MTPPLQTPRVSAIITSFNYEKYVGQAIASVLAQTYRPLELIVVDDGSTDGSREKIQSALAGAAIPVQTIFKKNGGQASALNAGFASATGDIIAFLDSDDLWDADRIEKMVSLMELAPGGAIYQHQLRSGIGLKRGGMLSGDIFRMWKQWGGPEFNLADDKCGILFSPFLPTSGLVFPRDVLKKTLPAPENLTTCVDAYLTRTAIVHGPLVSIPLVLGEWRDHGGNAGKSEAANFQKFWVPNVLPALNAYYERNNAGLRLVLEPGKSSPWAAGKMLGEIERETGGEKTPCVREIIEARRGGAENQSLYRRLRRAIGIILRGR